MPPPPRRRRSRMPVAAAAVAQALRLPAPPPVVAHLYSKEEFEKKRAYNQDKLRYSECTSEPANPRARATTPAHPSPPSACRHGARPVGLRAQHRPAAGGLPARHLASGGRPAGAVGLGRRDPADRCLGADPGGLAFRAGAVQPLPSSQAMCCHASTHTPFAAGLPLAGAGPALVCLRHIRAGGAPRIQQDQPQDFPPGCRQVGGCGGGRGGAGEGGEARRSAASQPAPAARTPACEAAARASSG